jgi:hypothetical protein
LLRAFLLALIPLLLPLALTYAYIAVARARARRSGEEPLAWMKGPWFWALIAGVVLFFFALVAYDVWEGYERGTRLEPPRVIDGKMTPARPLEEGEDNRREWDPGGTGEMR